MNPPSPFAQQSPSTGIVTDPQARVLGADNRPIPGLWAAGNDANSIMAGSYPGPGITLGPALTFGWIAARNILEQSKDAQSVDGTTG